MTRKIGGQKPTIHPASTAQKSKSASATKQAVKAAPAKRPAAAEGKFPRSSWKDSARLGAQINRSLQAGEHPRLRHLRGHQDPIGATDPQRPPIAMRYGVIRPDPGPVRPPPIAMRYGVIRPDPNPAPPPPIAMRYGVIRPDPNPVRPPPIAMRYGVIRPQPRDAVETKPRQ